MVVAEPSIRIENFRHYPKPRPKYYSVFDEYDEVCLGKTTTVLLVGGTAMVEEKSANHSLYLHNTVGNWMIVQEEPGGSSVVVHAPLEEEIGETRALTKNIHSSSMFQVSNRKKSATPVSMARSTSSRMDYLGANMPTNMMTRRRSMRDAMLEMESGELELPPRKPSILHQQPPTTAILVPPTSALGGLSALGAMMDNLGATAVAVAAPKRGYTPLRIDLMAGRPFCELMLPASD